MLSSRTLPVCDIEGNSAKTISDNHSYVTFQPPLVDGYGVGHQYSHKNVLPPSQQYFLLYMHE